MSNDIVIDKPTLNPELEEKVRLLDKLQQELVGRKRDKGMEFYVPNPIQYKAHKSLARIIAIVKGNRMGGSTWGALEVCYHLTKQYPDWYPMERRLKGPLKIRIATDRFFKIDSVIEPKLRQYLPKDEITRMRRSPQGYIMKMHTKDGSFVEFLTSEQDQMAWEGQDLDFFWGDEPMKKGHWIATQRGLLDRGGRSILSFTPLIEPWMKEEIVDREDGKNIAVFYGSTRDNKYDIEGNVILTEEDIAWFEGMMDEDERKTRIEGRFFHLKGLVYKELNPAVHFITDFDYQRDYVRYPVICVLDPHDRLPHWLIWAMVDRTNDLYIMYELVKEGTVQQVAAAIKATEEYFGWNVTKRLIDPNFGRKPLISTGLSVIGEFSKYKVGFSEALDSKEGGRLKVKEYLHYNKDKPIDINNRPKLYFVKDKVPKTIHSLMNYQYDEWKGNSAGERDPKEDNKPKDAHGADCIRYLCMSSPTYDMPTIYAPQEAYY